MATLRTDHQPKYQPYKDRDALLSWLLDENAVNQRMADTLELIAAALRKRATKMGHLIDPPAPQPTRPADERRQGYRRRDDRTPSPLRLLLDDDRPLMHTQNSAPAQNEDAAA